MKRRLAFTLVELLIGLTLVSILIGAIYAFLHLMFWGGSRSNLAGLTRRSFIQKDAKTGLRQLVYRLREGTQILSPALGSSSGELVFRDIVNTDVRLRLVPGENRLVSEVNPGGTWVRETAATMIGTGTDAVPAAWPISMANCSAVHFTVLSGESVAIAASIEWEGQVGSLFTVVKLRNSTQAY